MYIGRFLIVAPDVAVYRVSSRSFPDRQMVDQDGRVSVVPTGEASETDNPYISYNCVRVVDTPEAKTVVLGNGSHVDPIAEKLELGYPARDALATSLLALDFERDEYDTPRIAGAIGAEAYIGIVRRDALIIEAVTEPTLVATYGRNTPEPFDFTVTTAQDAARTALELAFEHPICAAGIAKTPDGFDLALENGSDTAGDTRVK